MHFYLNRGHPIVMNLCERIAFGEIIYLCESNRNLSKLSKFHVDKQCLSYEKGD